MKVYYCSKKVTRPCYAQKTAAFLFLLVFISLTGPVSLFSQTIPLSFKPISYSAPDIIAPGRGAEQWDNGSEKINNPSADTNYKSLDVYYRFPWTRLEDSIAGKYNWTHFDNIIKDAIDHGQKLSFGIMTVYDGVGTVVYDSAKSAYPLYLHKLMKADAVNNRDWISHGVWIPNWNSPHYLARLRALHTALNAHILASTYKGVAFKNAIYCIDIRGYGNYGEWHNAGIVNHAYEYPTGRRATAATLKTIINHHTQVFTLWPLTIMIAAFDGEQFDAIMNPAEVGYYALTTSNTWGPLGWRRDQWGATDDYLDKILKNNEIRFGSSKAFKELITTRCLTSPVTGEPPSYINEGGPCEYWDLERQLTDYGATSLGNGNWGSKLSECGLQNARAAFKRSGYRLILAGGSISKNISADQSFSVSLDWRNTGIAPTYENWDVFFELKNAGNITVWSGMSAFKPKRFAPADTAIRITDIFNLPAGIKTDSCKLNIIIRDPAGYRTPLPLAIEGRNADGSYTLSTIRQSPAYCVPPTASISNLSACEGKAFGLVLDSASGTGPYDLVINGNTYNGISVGQNITTINPAPQSIWNIKPSPASYEDQPVELGVKFKALETGFVKGIRFFSSNTPRGIYTGHLWTKSGSLLGSVTFSGVTAGGWQEALFTTPIHIMADTVYVASYHTSGGQFAATTGGLINATANGSLIALADGVSGRNGLYKYGAAGSFPSDCYNATNYWVDVVFMPATHTLNLSSVTDSGKCNNSGALQTLVIVSGNSCGTIPPSDPQSLPTATIECSSPCNGEPFNLFLKTATGPGPYDLVINGTAYTDIIVGQSINTFKTQAHGIWDTLPSPLSYQDASVELGVKFKSSTAGLIKGLRFFSPSHPSGVYTGHLWSADGTLLDSVLFTSVTANGWQEALFANPVQVTANITYVASYHTDGHYAATAGGLSNAVINGPLAALENTSPGGNGVFSYGNSPIFPSSSYNATNYWVDVIFTGDGASPAYTFNLTGVTDNNGNNRAGNLQTLTVSPTNNCDTVPAGDLPTVVIGNSPSCTGEAFSVVLDSASGPGPYDLVINGNTYYGVLPGDVITTVGPANQTIWDTIPSPNSYEDAPAELGIKFKTSVAGFINGIRFFSPANPSGIYTGHLWTAGGTLLDSVVFTKVTASGWQQALFAKPLAVAANTIYIVSYHTTGGYYAATTGGLLNAVNNGNLTALAANVAGGNGLYGYGTAGTFPSNSLNATNYWVDVIFSRDADYTYTFNLTSVTDHMGLTKSGDLQTLAVSSTDCEQARTANRNMETVKKTQPIKLSSQQAAIQWPAKIHYNLQQNFPNPFSNTTTIQYSLPEPGRVSLMLFDINGKMVKLLVNGSKEAGIHAVNLDAGAVASGLYFYKLQAGNFSAVKKMIIQ